MRAVVVVVVWLTRTLEHTTYILTHILHAITLACHRYVMQEDALFATQTPREALMFSAALRLPKSYTHAQRVSLVENIIVALGLTKCADTLIGSHMIPGISGGEKKRTAIGIELVRARFAGPFAPAGCLVVLFGGDVQLIPCMWPVACSWQVASPDILFLDEPTSGLDSFAAYQVVRILKDLAAAGRTVVTTIHQPSSEVFDNFSNVLLLANGRLVYHSPVHDMTSYFARVGQQLAPQVDPKQFICHPNYNPADFIMFLLQQQTSEGIDLLAGEWIREVAAANTAIQAGDVEDGELRKRSLSASSFTVATKSARDNYAAKLKEKVERPGFCVQFRCAQPAVGPRHVVHLTLTSPSRALSAATLRNARSSTLCETRAA